MRLRLSCYKEKSSNRQTTWRDCEIAKDSCQLNNLAWWSPLDFIEQSRESWRRAISRSDEMDKTKHKKQTQTTSGSWKEGVHVATLCVSNLRDLPSINGVDGNCRLPYVSTAERNNSKDHMVVAQSRLDTSSHTILRLLSISANSHRLLVVVGSWQKEFNGSSSRIAISKRKCCYLSR